MDEIHPVPDHVLRRLPGLFRRWELAEVIEAGKDYHVEDAGSACDGTTLYALYVSADVAPATDVDDSMKSTSRPRPRPERAALGASCAPWIRRPAR
jgi:hypothetical protein